MIDFIRTIWQRVCAFFQPLSRAAEKLSFFTEKLRQKISPFEMEVIAFISTFLLSFGTMYCLITAHSIPVSGIGMFFGCTVISAVAVMFFLVRQMLSENEEKAKHRLALEISVPAGLLLTGLIARKPLIESARVALSISAQIYGLSFPEPEEGVFLPEKATLFMLCLALLPAITGAWTVMYSKTPFIAAAGSVPIFSASIIMFEQLPSAWAVCIFIYALGLITLTHRARSYSDEAGFLHTARVAPALAAFVLVLALIINPSQYETPKWWADIQDRTYAIVDEILSSSKHNEFNYVDTTTIVGSESMDLNELSSQQKLGIEVMSIRLNDNGACYLRAVSYAGYKNNEWQMLSEREAGRINELIESPLTEPRNNTSNAYSVLIRTEEVNPYIYIPYYPGAAPESSMSYGDACIQNTGALMVYHFDRGALPSQNTYSSDYCEDYDLLNEYQALVNEYYLEVPENTAEKLRELAAQAGIISPEEAAAGGISPDSPIHAEGAVNRLALYVQSCAPYSLDPTPVPDGADFPVWFLTEAESGYCTHFAASGALMLRAIGIPARLTTGYYVGASDEDWRVVTSDDAHAWIEYYLPEYGWQVLEVTGRYTDQQTGTDSGGEGGSAVSSETSSTTTTTTASTEIDTTTTASAPDGTASSSKPDGGAQQGESQSGNLSFSDGSGDGLNSEGEKGRSGSGGKIAAAILWIILILAAICGGLVLARRLINEHRHERFTTGSSNQRVQAMWDNILRLSAALGISPPEQIEDIMLKARFSQHTISEAELMQVKRYMEKNIADLSRTQSFLSGLVHKYIMFYY